MNALTITVVHDFSSLLEVVPKLVEMLAGAKIQRAAAQSPAVSAPAAEAPANAPQAQSAPADPPPADKRRVGRPSKADKAAAAEANTTVASKIATVQPSAPVQQTIPGFGAAPASAPAVAKPTGGIPGFDAPAPTAAPAPAADENAEVPKEELAVMRNYILDLSFAGGDALYQQAKAESGETPVSAMKRGAFNRFKARLEQLVAENAAKQ